MAGFENMRCKQPSLAFAIATAFLVTSCSSLLPPSLRKLDEPVPEVVASAPPTAAADKAASNIDTMMEPKTYPGTGIFVNPNPAAPPAAPGPEEASLNFESLDIREVSKVILGD